MIENSDRCPEFFAMFGSSLMSDVTGEGREGSQIKNHFEIRAKSYLKKLIGVVVLAVGTFLWIFLGEWHLAIVGTGTVFLVVMVWMVGIYFYHRCVHPSPYPLYSAAAVGDVKEIAALLRAGVDPDSHSGNGYGALHRAAEAGHTEAVTALIAGGANPIQPTNHNGTPLHYAANAGHAEVIAVLTASGVDPNICSFGSPPPLHGAAEEGHAEAIVTLVRAGADPDGKDSKDCTPLHRAAKAGRAEAIFVLLEAGADPNAKDTNAFTPLHYAAERGHAAAIAALIGSGANPNASGRHGIYVYSPLMLAIQRGHDEAAAIIRAALLFTAIENGGTRPRSRTSSQPVQIRTRRTRMATPP